MSPFVFKTSGVIIASISDDRECSEVREGGIITQVGGSVIGNVRDYSGAVAAIKKGEHVSMIINNGPGWCIGVEDGDIGIAVINIPSNQVNFGIDIQGGTTTLLRPKEATAELEDVVKTIEKRIGVLGLPETKVELSDNTIKITSLTEEKVSVLTVIGEFGGKIVQEIKLENKSGAVKIGATSYEAKVTDTELSINGSSYREKQRFVLEGIELDVLNITNTSFTIEANVLSNEDVLNVLDAFSYARYNPNFRNYEFNVPLEISSDAIDRFTKVVRGLKTSFAGAQIMLDGRVVYYIDGTQISSLNIPFEMSTQEITNLAVMGFVNSLTEAANQKLKVQAILASDKLPVELEVVGTEDFEPSLRMVTISMFLCAVLFAIVVVFASSFLWYKKVVLLPYYLMLLGMELACVIGIAALSQAFHSPGWILDFPSMIGITVLIVVSSIQMLLLMEKAFRKKELTLKYKYKKILSVKTFLDVLFLIVSFSILFTPWKGFGFSMVTGLVMNILLIVPIHKNVLKV